MKRIEQPQGQAEAASRRRARVLATIYGAGSQGITIAEVAEAADMHKETVTKIVAKLRASEIVVSVSRSASGAMRLYAPEFVPADPEASPAIEEAPLQVAGRRTLHPFADKSPFIPSGMTPVRPGADMHLSVPSLRGSQRVAHRPTMGAGQSS